MKKNKEIKCEECGGKAMFFHSRCCDVHFEGVINKKGEFTIACEKCGKYAAHLIDIKKLKLINK